MLAKLTTLFSIFFLIISNLYSQNPSCNGTRYKNPVFSTYDSVMSVTYGNNTRMSGANQVLDMNIYYPSGDVATKRPLIIFAHGGSFVSGTKDEVIPLCKAFALQGYVTATISYRLIDILISDSTALSEAVVMATSDMKAAVRYFREDAATSNSYKIDTNFIFVSGVSAGAITANHVAYLDASDAIPAYLQTAISNNGGFDGNSSTNTQYSSKVHGVLNYSGGLGRDYWINSNDAPIYSAHDDGDQTVPCNYGPAPGGIISINIYGSCALETRANSVGVTNQSFIINGSSGHVSYFSLGNPHTITILQESATFLHDIICGASAGIETSQENALFTIFPNPSEEELTINTNDSKLYNVELVNFEGKVVYNKTKVLGKHTFNINKLSKGIYTCNIVFNNGEISSKRIVKQ